MEKRRRLYSTNVKHHSLTRSGKKTSITLEDSFWDGLRVIARNENISVATLIERIAAERAGNNLSSSIRLFVLHYFQTLSRHSSSKATSDLTPSAHNQAR